MQRLCGIRHAVPAPPCSQARTRRGVTHGMASARSSNLRRRTVELSMLSLLVPAASAGEEAAAGHGAGLRGADAAVGSQDDAASQDEPSTDAAGKGGRSTNTGKQGQPVMGEGSEAGSDDDESGSESDSDSDSSSSSDEEGMIEERGGSTGTRGASKMQRRQGSKGRSGDDGDEVLKGRVEEEGVLAEAQRKAPERELKEQTKAEKRLGKEARKAAAEAAEAAEAGAAGPHGVVEVEGGGVPWPVAAGTAPDAAAGDQKSLSWLLGELLR